MNTKYILIACLFKSTLAKDSEKFMTLKIDSETSTVLVKDDPVQAAKDVGATCASLSDECGDKDTMCCGVMTDGKMVD